MERSKRWEPQAPRRGVRDLLSLLGVGALAWTLSWAAGILLIPSRDPRVPVVDAAPAGVPVAPRHELTPAPTPTATGLQERARPGTRTQRTAAESTLLLIVSGGRVAGPTAGSGEERRLFLRRTALWLRAKTTAGTPAERIPEAEVAENHKATATHRIRDMSPEEIQQEADKAIA